MKNTMLYPVPERHVRECVDEWFYLLVRYGVSPPAKDRMA